MSAQTVPTLGDVPRLSTVERIERLLGDAVNKAKAAIEADLDRRDFDSAWAGAVALHELLESYRAEASRERGRVIVRTARDDERPYSYLAKRFGISPSRITQLTQQLDDEGK